MTTAMKRTAIRPYLFAREILPPPKDEPSVVADVSVPDADKPDIEFAPSAETGGGGNWLVSIFHLYKSNHTSATFITWIVVKYLNFLLSPQQQC